MRYALAALLALAIGSQADAQLIRRYARPAYTPAYSQSYYTSPSYTMPGGVVTAGYYSPSTWSSGVVYPSSYSYPSSYFSTPVVGFGVNSGYSNYGYGTRYYGGWGRRGWRW